VPVVLRRLGGNDGSVSVNLSTLAITASPGTPTSGIDFSGFTNLVVSWADGDTALKTNLITIFNDSVVESNETARVFIDTPSFGLGLGTATNALLTIIDDDGTAGLDFNFGDPSGGFNGEVFAVAQLPNGQLVAGGLFTAYGTNSRSRLARLNTDGTLDTLFNQGLGPDGTVYELTVLPDGRLLVGGNFTSIGGIGRRRVARYQADGSLDTAFSPLTGADAPVFALAAQVDGKILAGGSFSSFGTSPARALVRLNASGSVDSTFSVGSGFNGIVLDVLVYTNTASTNFGKILVGGSFTAYNSTPVNNLVRLNSNGTIDNGFVTGSGPDQPVFTIALDGTERVLIGGVFGNYNGAAAGRLARLSPSGALDSGFSPALDAAVSAVAAEPSGAIVAGGNFTVIGGTGLPPLPGQSSSTATTNINRIVRYQNDGSLDIGFIEGGNGANDVVNDLVIQSDLKVVIVGAFTSVNGRDNGRIARLNGAGSGGVLTALGIPGVMGDRSIRMRLSGEAGRVFRIQSSSDLVRWDDIATVQSMAGEVEWQDSSSVSEVIRYYRAIRVDE
jgi:uncharacterized delta-60 repeat protein